MYTYTWLHEKYLHYISFIKKIKANLLNCILILYFQIGIQKTVFL